MIEWKEISDEAKTGKPVLLYQKLGSFTPWVVAYWDKKAGTFLVLDECDPNFGTPRFEAVSYPHAWAELTRPPHEIVAKANWAAR